MCQIAAGGIPALAWNDDMEFSTPTISSQPEKLPLACGMGVLDRFTSLGFQNDYPFVPALGFCAGYVRTMFHAAASDGMGLFISR